MQNTTTKISYELALSLKDVGFPQKKFGDGINHWHDDSEFVYIPTLEEAIEACGERFDEFTRSKHKPKVEWNAVAYPCEECELEGMFIEKGKTPLEAVLKLWLALQK